jgi:hypothetical protein
VVDGVERGPRRGLRAGPVVAAGAAAAVAAGALLFSGGGDDSSTARTPARTGPPAPVSALEAELRLELRFGGHGDNETSAVRCPYRIEPGQLVRCELRYADGIARAMLVRLTPSGELEAAIPYPATLRR